MGIVLDELIALLSLEKIEENLYRGPSQDLGWGTVYGGQVLGQALSAAAKTVPDNRHVHSLHAYFLRPGDVSMPVVYHVDRIRDGGSFTTRRVVAVQKGEPIFNVSASFQIVEEGFDHGQTIPDVVGPAGLQNEHERRAVFKDELPPFLSGRVQSESPFEFRLVEPMENPFENDPLEPKSAHWFRTTGSVEDDPALHRYLLAYASDYSFLITSLRPHGLTWIHPQMQVASIDHAMWFHRPFRIDEWLLHVVESPSASGARGFVRGNIFDVQGKLVASTAQEGLIRKRSKQRTEKR